MNRSGKLLPLLLFLSVAGCLAARESEGGFYRISPGSYSPLNNEILATVELPQGGDYLFVYNLTEKKVRNQFLSQKAFDFAWAPGRAEFLVTDSSSLVLFCQSEGKDEAVLSGVAVAAPVNWFYTFCSWSERGSWAAVHCSGMDEPFDERLGLYNAKDRTFQITKIEYGLFAPCLWKDDQTLFVPNENELLEVSLDKGTPQIAKRLPVEHPGRDHVLAFVNGEFLMEENGCFRLGENELVSLDEKTVTCCIATQQYLFVSTSESEVLVTDLRKRTVLRAKSARPIAYWARGKEADTVFGVAGDQLLRISCKDDKVLIETIICLDPQ